MALGLSDYFAGDGGGCSDYADILQEKEMVVRIFVLFDIRFMERYVC